MSSLSTVRGQRSAEMEALKIISSVAEVIKEMGTIPSPMLYSKVMGYCSIEVYHMVVEMLAKNGYISKSSSEGSHGSYRLKWTYEQRA